jgi:hypothetical protein
MMDNKGLTIAFAVAWVVLFVLVVWNVKYTGNTATNLFNIDQKVATSFKQQSETLKGIINEYNKILLDHKDAIIELQKKHKWKKTK